MRLREVSIKVALVLVMFAAIFANANFAAYGSWITFPWSPGARDRAELLREIAGLRDSLNQCERDPDRFSFEYDFLHGDPVTVNGDTIGYGGWARRHLLGVKP